jgi:hypothetical protein
MALPGQSPHRHQRDKKLERQHLPRKFSHNVEVPMNCAFLQRQTIQLFGNRVFSIAPARAFAPPQRRARGGIYRAKIFFAKIAVTGASSGAARRKTRESEPSDSFLRWRERVFGERA